MRTNKFSLANVLIHDINKSLDRAKFSPASFEFRTHLRTIVSRMRTTSAPADAPLSPGTLLFGKARGRLLTWLYAHPDERFYLRQLVALTGVAQGAVRREVQLLTAAGW